jgi:Fe-S cluster biogenesis protein NfuA
MTVEPGVSEPEVATPADGQTPADGPLSDAERAARLDALTELLDLIRPAVQADGGDLALVHADVETGEVEVMLQGSCSSCAVSSTTLQAGVSRILRDRLEWVTTVTGGVDDTLDYEESSSMGRGGYVPRF